MKQITKIKSISIKHCHFEVVTETGESIYYDSNTDLHGLKEGDKVEVIYNFDAKGNITPWDFKQI